MNNILENIELHDLWTQYLTKRDKGDKKGANQLLNRFIVSLKNEDERVIYLFANEICSRNLNQQVFLDGYSGSRQTINLQHPLFKEIIIPFLEKQYAKDDGQSIRWIGQLEQFFYSDKRTARTFLAKISVDYPFDAIFFLEKSYELNPEQLTLELLLMKIAKRLDFAVHEIPIGVLWKPKVFNDEVIKFKGVWEQSEEKEKWSEKIEYWTLIGVNWGRYCQEKVDYVNFEDFLDKKNTKLS